MHKTNFSCWIQFHFHCSRSTSPCSNLLEAGFTTKVTNKEDRVLFFAIERSRCSKNASPTRGIYRWSTRQPPVEDPIPRPTRWEDTCHWYQPEMLELGSGIHRKDCWPRKLWSIAVLVSRAIDVFGKHFPSQSEFWDETQDKLQLLWTSFASVVPSLTQVGAAVRSAIHYKHSLFCAIERSKCSKMISSTKGILRRGTRQIPVVRIQSRLRHPRRTLWLWMSCLTWGSSKNNKIDVISMRAGI